ncbi:MAG: ribosome small subunit-dependent GTPase A [Bacteroidota bacterium]
MKKGLVIKSTGSWYVVKDTDGIFYECRIKGNLRIKGLKTTNPLAVGDWVDFDWLEKDSQDQNRNMGLIYGVEERRNYIIRRSQNLSKQAHIIAANIDQAFLIITINYPVTTTTFIDRFLASAEAYRIPVVLVFNKTDRYDPLQTQKMMEYISIYEKIGYRCMQLSALEGSGMEELKAVMKDSISVFSGHSGVGKSTIINAIQPELNLKTKEISDYHETGKHTTTFSELFELDLGGYIIDTPGIKAFGMLEMEPWEISHYFVEIFKISKNCQYNNCSHTHEPGCAVKEAYQKGEIAESRFISYLGLLETDQKYRPAY